MEQIESNWGRRATLVEGEEKGEERERESRKP